MQFNVVESDPRVSWGRLKDRECVERSRGRVAAQRSGEREEKKSLKAERVAASGGNRRRRFAADMTAEK